MLSSSTSLTIMKRINRSINSSIINRTSIRSISISSSASSIGINNIRSINNNSNNSNSRYNSNSSRSSNNSNSSRIFRRYFSASYQTIGMPSLSPTMTHGTIASWLKKPGNIY